MKNYTQPDLFDVLKKLLDSYHEMTEGREGYRVTDQSGDDTQVLMLLNRTSDGGITIKVMGVADFISMIPITELLTAEKLADPTPSIAYSSVTFEPEK